MLIHLITDSLCMFVFLFEQKKVTLNTFLDTLMSDPPPQCLVWLPLLHRLANVENGKSCCQKKTPHYKSKLLCEDFLTLWMVL